MPGNADKCPSVFPEAKDDVFKLFCPNSSELKQRQFLKFENRGKTGAEAAIREYLVILLEKRISSHQKYHQNVLMNFLSME